MANPASTSPAPASPPPVGARAQDFAAVGDWPGYFRAVRGKGPRETLSAALALFDKESLPENRRLAVDLACGEGRDTIELLRQGWTVTAIDSHPDGLEKLEEQIPSGVAPRLTARLGSFESANWPPCLLLNCSFALPFCRASEFVRVWSKVVSSIEPGGRFAGQFFGDRDTWARSGHTLGHTRSQVNDLFGSFLFDSFREEEKDDKDAQGNPKHWHVFHVVASKRGEG